MTPTEMFERIGRALTMGRDSRIALSRPPWTSGRILFPSSGRMALRAGHFQDLLAAIVAQREELARVEQELREWLAKQPEEEERKTDAP